MLDTKGEIIEMGSRSIVSFSVLLQSHQWRGLIGHIWPKN